MSEQTDATAAEQPISGNPYVGPRPFTQEDRRRFFGRDREARDLLSQVISERLLLFYAPSGAGKSSLLETRLIPALQDKRIGYTMLPKGRVGGELPEGVPDRQVANIYVYNLILSLLPDMQQARRLTRMPLRRFLAGLRCTDGQSCEFDEAAAKKRATKSAQSRPSSQDRPRVLVIDQFEEIVTTHSGRWQDRENFFKQLDEAMSADPLLWVLLILREDYVASLDPYARLVANNLRQRNYMQRMDRSAALEAIKGPAQRAGRPFTDEAAEELARRLSLVRVQGQEQLQEGQYIEPMLLQVVCYRLWDNIKDKPGADITINELQKFGDVDTELMGFYDGEIAGFEVTEQQLEEMQRALAKQQAGVTEQQLEEMQRALAKQQAGVTEQQLRDWFERRLITEARTRSFVPKGATSTASMPNEVVDLLENYLLRIESRAGGRWVELIHDTFIEPIVRSNRRWREAHRSPITLAAEAWRRSGERPISLLMGEALNEARARLERTPDEFTEIEKRFIRASAEADEQRREILAAQRTARLEPEKYLSETGWGVIFAHDADPRIHEALAPLLELRRTEATKRRQEYYWEFIGKDGYRPGETARNCLDRHKVGPGQVAPAAMPYYLLIVGDPETIPFEFQYELSLRFAVGRIHFDEIENYRRYADSVVRVETGENTGPRRAAFFAPRQPDFRAVEIGISNLVEPLLERLEQDKPDWVLSRVIGESATKARLGRLLGGDETPALLFVLSTGVEFPNGNERQLVDNGAILCQDWPGPRAWSGRGLLPKEFYFAADDLEDGANVRGLVAFLFGTSTAGTPKLDDFWQQAFKERQPIAPRAFLARLAQRLLAHPAGGTLAVIGHVERGWTWSFDWPGAGNRTGVETYAASLARLMEGFPVGAAMEPFTRRHAEFAADLLARLRENDNAKSLDPFELRDMWTATIDARNWIIVGDPAVRLMVSGLRPDTAALDQWYRTEDQRERADRLAQEGNLNAATTAYAKALEMSPWLAIDPEVEAKRVAAREPLRAARKLAEQGKVDEAVAQYEQAMKLYPTPGLDPRAEAERLAAPWFVQQGRTLALAGSVSEAVTQFERAAALDPSLGIRPKEEAGRLAAPRFVAEGRKLAGEGRVAGAVPQFEQAIALDPTLGIVPQQEAGRLAAPRYLDAGRKLAEGGHIEQAMEQFEQAIALDPSLKLDPKAEAGRLAAPVFVERGRQLAAQGQLAEAEVAFRQALRLDPALKLDLAAELQQVKRLVPGAGLAAKLWSPGQTLWIKFLDGEPPLRKMVEETASEWSKYANIEFAFGDTPQAEIRVTFEAPGGWSYSGRDALSVPQDRPTVGLGALKGSLSSAEAGAIVLRVFGYVLGLIREHQNPNANIRWNRDALYAFYQGAPNYWTRAQVEEYFFTKVAPEQLKVVKDFDPLSIMMPQISKEFTLDGFETGTNLLLSEKDREAIAQIYPRPDAAGKADDDSPAATAF
jgi:tetratricopeptide (TPR) repeat protein